MRKLVLIGATVIGATVLSASPFSVRWSAGKLSPQHMFSVSLDSANAVIGRPLTPGSVAGVHRRVGRRTARYGYYGAAAAAGAIGAGAYYGGYGHDPHQYYDYYRGQGSTAESANSCAARFRSYNPATGTYLGYDGLNHPCP
jgi:BA14K-like protein